MRSVVFALLALAGCEIQPAPKKQPAPVQAPTTPAPAPTLPVVGDAGVSDATGMNIEGTKECITLAAHLADVFVQSATDPAQHAIYEQERMRSVKAMADACTKQHWTDAAQKCYAAATTPVTVKDCENKFPPPPPPGAGVGSAGSAAR